MFFSTTWSWNILSDTSSTPVICLAGQLANLSQTVNWLKQQTSPHQVFREYCFMWHEAKMSATWSKKYYLFLYFCRQKACEGVKLASQLFDITQILTERHANISLNRIFHINSKYFTFNASSSKKEKDVSVSQEKVKKKSPSQKILLEYKEKVLEKMETPTTPDKQVLGCHSQQQS